MAWKFQQIEPAVARGTLREELWDDPVWVAEEKYDGDRRIAQFCGGTVRFTGRRKSVKDGFFVEKTTNVPHLSGTMCCNDEGRFIPVRAIHQGAAGELPVSVPSSLEGTVLDGEMIVDCVDVSKKPLQFNEGRSKYVTSIMGSDPEEAIRKQIERGWLRYVVFDCLFFEGRDLRQMPQEARRLWARDAVKAWGNPFVALSESVAHLKRAFYHNVTAHGGEGIILKNVNAVYGDRQAWVKVKREWTADVVITGFEMAKEESKKKSGVVSKTKFAGMVGAVSISQWKYNEHGGYTLQVSKPGRGVSGMDDATRADITAHPKKYLGKVLRIKHNGREPTGFFRHPRWDGLRDDKSPKDCVFDLEEK